MGVTFDHFKRAAVDIGAHGDNDTLPFDLDTQFVKENATALAELAFAHHNEFKALTKQRSIEAIDSLALFSERLLTPTGVAGFRITTKIHPFWNLYLNGLAVAIAEKLEPLRDDRAHSYRFVARGERLFARSQSWRTFLEATITDCEAAPDAIVVQTDISSFYEHISHHRIENFVDDLFPDDPTISARIDRFLSRFAAGRSFGLPVGGQCSRILAELLMTAIDRQLNDAKITWRRYVDDFVLVMPSKADAYRALASLAHSLADYGLTLNRTKTLFLTSKHYVDYVRTQLKGGTPEATKLVEIDLHFDPYSDTADNDYAELQKVVGELDIRALLELELRKSQPDNFLVTQIGRTLKLHNSEVALQLCSTLLSGRNLHAFRGAWSAVMRGVAELRRDPQFSSIHKGLDDLLDQIPNHSAHLLIAEASCLYYLRTIRFQRTEPRAQYVWEVYTRTSAQTVKRACIDCWRQWDDRSRFISERNKWNSLRSEEQRMLWAAAGDFGNEGAKFRSQVYPSLNHAWRLGIERENSPSFGSLYIGWVNP